MISNISQLINKKGLEKEVLVHRLAQAQSRLKRAEHNLDLARIRSPIDGIVLERNEPGDRTLPSGRPLLLVGSLDQLEVVSEVLTQDALRLTLGGTVRLESAAGNSPITGKVKRIEPQGFTKRSSLGVEQQRVNVIVTLDAKPKALGTGYRLHARFFTGAKGDARQLLVNRFPNPGKRDVDT